MRRSIRALQLSLAASLWAVILCGCASMPLPPDSPHEFVIAGDVREPDVWTAERIESTFADQIRVVEHRAKDRTFRLRALPLAALIQHAGPMLDAEAKHPELAVAVAIEARDGYTVAFTLEEIAPYKAEPTILLAFAEADGPFPDDIAPARLIIPGAQRSSRALHAIRAIRVDDLRR